jgi:xylan 1,4-beta-xylosidase
VRRGLLLLLAALALAAPTFSNPVIPGDHPDPTVVRADGAFYLSATTSAWAPVFPIFRSVDLVNWSQVSAVLPQPPRWATGKFWAPELTSEPGRVLAYWGAARRDGKPCIALSTAPQAEGPWRYRGRVTCPRHGAIDAAPFRDADGSRWLLWKEMGPGGGIRIQRLTGDGRRAVGHSHQLIAPDTKWEQSVTEGPSLVRQGNEYLLFYSGGHCCRVPCSYGEGVARASSLLGPYIKDPDNPILASGPDFKCPGHGTVLRLSDGGLVLVHHAYRADDAFDLRRQVLIDPVTIDPDGWPTVGAGATTLATGSSPLGAVQQPAPTTFTDGFTGPLAPGWEWLFDARPDARTQRGALVERCGGPLRFVARQVAADRLTATTAIDPPVGDTAVGLAVDLDTGVRGIEVRHGRVRAFAAGPQRRATGPSVAVPGGTGRIVLTLGLAPGGHVGTYVARASAPAALTRVPEGPAATGAEPTRIALTCRGHGAGRFAYVRVRSS